MIFAKAIPEIERVIGYKFKDKTLLTQAFTRTSFCNEAHGGYQSNEVLEFLGDSVLSCAIITRLVCDLAERYEHGIKSKLGEGDFTNIKSRLSDKSNLSRSMARLGLQKYLIMGEGDAKLGIQNEPSVMEDLFESIIGAIYLDSGMSVSTAAGCIEKMLDISEYTAGNAAKKSPKNALQEWCADKSRKLPPPKYMTESESGPDHQKAYVRVCYIGDRLVGRGEGKNFKIADSAAAEDALSNLMREAEEAKEPKPAAANPTAKRKAKDEAAHKKSIKQKANEEAAHKESAKKNDGNADAPIDRDAPKKLREYAQANKLPAPRFKDLGETEGENGKTVYAVECALAYTLTVMTASTRQDAMARAAAEVLRLVSRQKPSKSPKSQVKQKGKIKK